MSIQKNILIYIDICLFRHHKKIKDNLQLSNKRLLKIDDKMTTTIYFVEKNIYLLSKYDIVRNVVENIYFGYCLGKIHTIKMF